MLRDFKFHHIGIATFDIEKTAKYYLDAGYKKTNTIKDAIQNVYICFLYKKGMPYIELLSPVDKTSPISKTLEKSGVSPYHCCYMVNDIESAITRLRIKNYILLSKPVIAVALENRKICFLFNKDVGLIEIMEQ
jgi:hypothetical protein